MSHARDAQLFTFSAACLHSSGEIDFNLHLFYCCITRGWGVRGGGGEGAGGVAKRRVLVSMSAFPASANRHCWSAGSSLGCGLNFGALVCDTF